MFNEIGNVNNLSNEDLFNLIFDIVEIKKLDSQSDADKFISFLTDNPAPLREATAYKLEELIEFYPDYFKNDLSKTKLLNGISDINPNICRSVCNIIAKNKFVSDMLTDDIIKKISEIIENIRIYEKQHKDFFQNKIKNKKNHAKNKLLFAMYWYMEALSLCDINRFEDKILNILNCTIEFCDYTIREKTVKLLTKLNNPSCEILQKAKTDENFYVKIQVYDKMNNEELN